MIYTQMSADKLPVQIRTRKFIRNALLARRQFVSCLCFLCCILALWFLIIFNVY
jgi:hypothetical protein